jgi:hypothetical protein
MTDGKSDPPSRAIWFLQHMCPSENEPLTGDLIEQFREGRTHGWFWRQVFTAFAVSIFVAIRCHWPYLWYAIAGTAMPLFWRDGERVPVFSHVLFQWSELSWRYGGQRFVNEIFAQFEVLEALPVFALALAVNRQFRWAIVFRTGVINVVLLALGLWSLGVISTIQSSLRPIADPHFMWLLTLPPPLVRMLFFSIFLVSAWVGRVTPCKGTHFRVSA